MSDLLTCPFCGGEAEIGYPLRYRNDIFTNQACCSKCGAAIYGEGIAANGATTNTKKKWNTRVERTCHIVPMDAAGNPPYRKGDLIMDSLSDGCSECGCPFDTLNYGVPNYCKNCGAKIKVVE